MDGVWKFNIRGEVVEDREDANFGPFLTVFNVMHCVGIGGFYIWIGYEMLVRRYKLLLAFPPFCT